MNPDTLKMFSKGPEEINEGGKNCKGDEVMDK